MPEKVFLDANVLIEILQHRRYFLQAKQVIEEHEQYSLVASILTVDLVLYYVEKDKSDKQAAFQFLSKYEILDMNSADYTWAQANDQADFEDALQVACALRHGCKKVYNLGQAVSPAPQQTHCDYSGGVETRKIDINRVAVVLKYPKRLMTNSPNYGTMEKINIDLAKTDKDYHVKLLLLSKKVDRLEEAVMYIAQETGVKIKFDF